MTLSRIVHTRLLGRTHVVPLRQVAMTANHDRLSIDDKSKRPVDLVISDLPPTDCQ
jgi:hypothetical protein